jgi:DNA adenine methylase
VNRLLIPAQAQLFPSTRFMGSKKKLLPEIYAVVRDLEFDTAIDAFSGSGVVSYLFKTLGKKVIANDHMHMSTAISKALIENNDVRLTANQVERLLSASPNDERFVETTFKGLYFSDDDCRTIDDIRLNLRRLRRPEARALAMTALIRACMKRRPRGVFTYVGDRYNDGRGDLQKSIAEHFIEAVHQVNDAVFDNGKINHARNSDVLELRPLKNALIYFDPPYFTPKSDNQYVRRYHFVEGLARNWEGVEIQEHTKTKKFRSYETPFSTEDGARKAFETIFRNFKDSTILVSYSSNSLPRLDEIVETMSRYKKDVTVIPIGHRYSFGNQGHKVGNNRNEVTEYLFLGK